MPSNYLSLPLEEVRNRFAKYVADVTARHREREARRHFGFV